MPDLASSRWNVSERARKLHADALVWDDHAGFEPHPSVDLSILEHWRAAGVDYLSINVGYDVVDWKQTVKNIGWLLTFLEQHPDRFTLIRRADDILEAKRQGKLAIAFDIEGMNSLDGESDMVSLYYRLGVRQMLFAYNLNNLAGGGCHDEDVGLTEFGRQVIAEMNRVGMVVDCSHCAYKTSMEAIEASKAPVIFSHANARKVWDHERNIWDDQIKACAATGGVIGVTGVGRFLGSDGPTVGHLVEHIDYMVQLVGPAHVGFGMDSVLHKHKPNQPFTRNREYWPERQYPDSGSGYVPPEEAPRLTQALLDRGYGDKDIRGILGGNFLRVAEAVWK